MEYIAFDAHKHYIIEGELLAQGKVLEGEVAVAADEEGEEPEQVKYEGDHERDCGRTGPVDQPLGWRTMFWRGTGQKTLS